MTDREIVKALRKQIHVRTVADRGGTNLLILAADAIERLEQDYDAVKQFFHTQCMKLLKENKQLESENAALRKRLEEAERDNTALKARMDATVSKLEIVERERDAAIADISHNCDTCARQGDVDEDCVCEHCNCDPDNWNTIEDCWQWRGERQGQE